MRDFILGSSGLIVMAVFFVINVVILFTTKIIFTRTVAILAVVGLGFAIVGHPLL